MQVRSKTYDPHDDEELEDDVSDAGSRAGNRSPRPKKKLGVSSHVTFADDVDGIGLYDQNMDLKKLAKIKARVNTGLTDADGSKNSRIIKHNLDLMKNPILAAIRKTLKCGAKMDARTKKEYQTAMVPSKMYEMMDNVMQEKVWIDIESETGDLVAR